ncbi:MAG: sterol desaturase family protein [Alphaproteobacteria bacterium]|nr:sterol desaturase family protein [Alphaproteobacteria bacterium]
MEIIVPITAYTASLAAHQMGFGLGQFIMPLGWPVELVVWISALTFMIYIVHFALHRVRSLWAFHRIHHCDENLEATSALRHHPVEDFIALVTGIALAFLLTPSLNTLVFAFAIIMLINLFNHSRIELPDRVSTLLEWIVVTPRLHRVHHSPLARQTDSNFGGTFTIWDRLFGTFCLERAAGMGLDHESLAGPNSRDFDTLMLEPFKFLFKGRQQD